MYKRAYKAIFIHAVFVVLLPLLVTGVRAAVLAELTDPADTADNWGAANDITFTANGDGTLSVTRIGGDSDDIALWTDESANTLEFALNSVVTIDLTSLTGDILVTAAILDENGTSLISDYNLGTLSTAGIHSLSPGSAALSNPAGTQYFLKFRPLQPDGGFTVNNIHASIIPEPTTLGLIFLGSILLKQVRKKRTFDAEAEE